MDSAKCCSEPGWSSHFTNSRTMAAGSIALWIVSTPGRRVYVTHDKIPSILAGMGVALVSTSKGVVTDREARKQKVGGEVLAYVW